MLVKVCGLTTMMNIEEIANLTPDYMGFVFYDKSPRYVGDSLNAIQLQHLDTRIKKTGVFVNEMPRVIAECVRTYYLNAIQLHGDEPLATVKESARMLGGVSIIKAFRIHEGFDFAAVADYEAFCSLFLFDAAQESYGGGGTSFNWDLLKRYTGSVPFLLAGGLSPENLEDALDVVAAHPLGRGVDLSSGLEIRPGVKSLTKTKEVIDIVRSYGLE